MNIEWGRWITIHVLVCCKCFLVCLFLSWDHHTYSSRGRKAPDLVPMNLWDQYLGVFCWFFFFLLFCRSWSRENVTACRKELLFCCASWWRSLNCQFHGGNQLRVMRAGPRSSRASADEYHCAGIDCLEQENSYMWWRRCLFSRAWTFGRIFSEYYDKKNSWQAWLSFDKNEDERRHRLLDCSLWVSRLLLP